MKAVILAVNTIPIARIVARPKAARLCLASPRNLEGHDLACSKLGIIFAPASDLLASQLGCNSSAWVSEVH
jgi:hypothetical protein